MLKEKYFFRKYPLLKSLERIVICFNGSHDGSASAIGQDFVFSLQEERIKRVKPWDDIVKLGNGYHHFADGWKRALSHIIYRIIKKCSLSGKDAEIASHILYGLSLRLNLVDHHMAHALSAKLLSEKLSFVISADGSGPAFKEGSDGSFQSGSFYEETLSVFKTDNILPQRLISVAMPHSLGGIYGSVAHHLNLGGGGEGKMMGLASYGDNSFHKYAKEAIKLNDNGTFALDPLWFATISGSDHNAMTPGPSFYASLGPPREKSEKIDIISANIASFAQKIVEMGLLNSLKAISLDIEIMKNNQEDGKIGLCGGVALNSVANAILQKAIYPIRLIITPAASDCGLSLGKAHYFSSLNNLLNRDFLLPIKLFEYSHFLSNNMDKGELHGEIQALCEQLIKDLSLLGRDAYCAISALFACKGDNLTTLYQLRKDKTLLYKAVEFHKKAVEYSPFAYASTLKTAQIYRDLLNDPEKAEKEALSLFDISGIPDNNRLQALEFIKPGDSNISNYWLVGAALRKWVSQDQKNLYDIKTMLSFENKSIFLKINEDIANHSHLLAMSENNWRKNIKSLIIPIIKNEIIGLSPEELCDSQLPLKRLSIIALSSNNEKIIKNMAFAAHNQGDFALAEKLWLKIFNIDPNYLPALENLSFIYGKNGDYFRGSICHSRFLRKGPKNEKTIRRQGDLLRLSKKYSLALRHYNKLFSIFKATDSKIEDHSLLIDRGICLFNLGFYERATDDFLEAASLIGWNSFILWHCALCYFNVRRFEKAREMLKSLRSIEPKNKDAKALLDDINNHLEKNGNDSDSSQQEKNNFDMNPSNPNFNIIKFKKSSKNIDLLLINPAPKKGRGFNIATRMPPYGLCALAANIRKFGFRVEILDMAAQCLGEYQAVQYALKSGAPYLGIGCDISTFESTRNIIRQVKKMGGKEIKTIVGGPWPSACPEQYLNYSRADHLIVGEADFSILKLIKQKDKDRIIHGNRVENLSDLPFPAFDLIPYDARYFGRIRKSPSFPLSTSRGCNNNCSFCSKAVSSGPWRGASAEWVIEATKWLKKDLKAQQIDIIDDSFLENRERAVEILRGLGPLKIAINFPNGLKVKDMDKKMISELKNAGTFRVGLGIESANNKVAEYNGKPHTAKKAKKLVKLLNKQKISTSAFFVLGLLNENKCSLQQTINYACHLGADQVNLALALPIPGTRLYEEGLKSNQLKSWYTRDLMDIKKKSKVIPGFFSNEGIIIPKNINEKDFNEIIIKAWRRYWFNPLSFWRLIRNMRSKGEFIWLFRLILEGIKSNVFAKD